MGRLNIDQIDAGMILATDVLDRNGRILLKEGLEITQKHLTILKQWGVTDADIAGVNQEEAHSKIADGFDQDLLHTIEAKYQEVFCHTDLTDPIIHELFRLSVNRAVIRDMSGAADDL